jgi:hypothetical protein
MRTGATADRGLVDYSKTDFFNTIGAIRPFQPDA